MDRSDVVELLGTMKERDEYGVIHEIPASRSVYCSVDSVTRAEFFDGGRNGLNPEIRVTMFGPDYQGETMLRWNGRTYAVYRTYIAKTDIIELYCERKGGTNGKGSD